MQQTVLDYFQWSDKSNINQLAIISRGWSWAFEAEDFANRGPGTSAPTKIYNQLKASPMRAKQTLDSGPLRRCERDYFTQSGSAFVRRKHSGTVTWVLSDLLGFKHPKRTRNKRKVSKLEARSFSVIDVTASREELHCPIWTDIVDSMLRCGVIRLIQVGGKVQDFSVGPWILDRSEGIVIGDFAKLEPNSLWPENGQPQTQSKPHSSVARSFNVAQALAVRAVTQWSRAWAVPTVQDECDM